jgi:hypothetical protein
MEKVADTVEMEFKRHEDEDELETQVMEYGEYI